VCLCGRPQFPGSLYAYALPPFSVSGSATNVLKVLTYIDLSATTAGISPDFSFYLVSISNAGSGLGRLAAGVLADKFGALTVTAPLTLLCAIMTYIWPYATTKGSLIAIGIIYGFCSGAYVSLVLVPLVMMGDVRSAGRRTGTGFSVIAFGALAGPPISGAIYQATGGFKDVGYYAGDVPDRTTPLSVRLAKMPSSSSQDRASS
jgi:MCP family monocarboxylic acid transporter-like MFS transporter 10